MWIHAFFFRYLCADNRNLNRKIRFSLPITVTLNFTTVTMQCILVSPYVTLHIERWRWRGSGHKNIALSSKKLLQLLIFLLLIGKTYVQRQFIVSFNTDSSNILNWVAESKNKLLKGKKKNWDFQNHTCCDLFFNFRRYRSLSIIFTLVVWSSIIRTWNKEKKWNQTNIFQFAKLNLF